MLHRFLEMESNFNFFHLRPPPASSSAALNFCSGRPFCRMDCLPPHFSHRTLLLNRAHIPREVEALGTQFGFSLFLSAFGFLSYVILTASSHSRDDSSDIHMEGRGFPSTSTSCHRIPAAILQGINRSAWFTILTSPEAERSAKGKWFTPSPISCDSGASAISGFLPWN